MFRPYYFISTLPVLRFPPTSELPFRRVVRVRYKAFRRRGSLDKYDFRTAVYRAMTFLQWTIRSLSCFLIASSLISCCSCSCDVMLWRNLLLEPDSVLGWPLQFSNFTSIMNCAETLLVLIILLSFTGFYKGNGYPNNLFLNTNHVCFDQIGN